MVVVTGAGVPASNGIYYRASSGDAADPFFCKDNDCARSNIHYEKTTSGWGIQTDSGHGQHHRYVSTLRLPTAPVIDKSSSFNRLRPTCGDGCSGVAPLPRVCCAQHNQAFLQSTIPTAPSNPAWKGPIAVVSAECRSTERPNGSNNDAGWNDPEAFGGEPSLSCLKDDRVNANGIIPGVGSAGSAGGAGMSVAAFRGASGSLKEYYYVYDFGAVRTIRGLEINGFSRGQWGEDGEKGDETMIVHNDNIFQIAFSASYPSYRCPAGTFVYHSGSHCCRVNRDADGQALVYTGSKCENNSFVDCPGGAVDLRCVETAAKDGWSLPSDTKLREACSRLDDGCGWTFPTIVNMRYLKLKVISICNGCRNYDFLTAIKIETVGNILLGILPEANGTYLPDHHQLKYLTDGSTTEGGFWHSHNDPIQWAKVTFKQRSRISQ